MTQEEIKEKIMNNLSEIPDPHMGISIVEMGLIEKIELNESNSEAKITVKPTNPGCMSVANIAMAVRLGAEKVEGIDKAEIEVVQHMMADTINEMVNKDYD